MSSSSSSSSSHASKLIQPLPKTYRAAVVEKAGGGFKIEERPLPTPGYGQVLIQVLACGACHSDSFVVEGSPLSSYPRVCGHELVGIVAALGEGAKRWQVGDYVGRGWHGDHCFSCKPCLHGSFVNCEMHAATGITMDGGYAEYNVSPWQALARVPDTLDPNEAGPLMCAGVTVFNSIRNQHLLPGALVAVQGIGGLGHLAIQFASAMGYKVVAISTSQKKKELAMKLGASVYLDTSSQNVVEELKKLGGARLIVGTAFSAKAQSELVPGLGLDGTLLVLGADFSPLTIPPLAILGIRGRIQGWPSGAPIDSEETMEFAAFKGVKTHVETYGLDEVQKAYERMMSNEARFRVVIVPHKK